MKGCGHDLREGGKVTLTIMGNTALHQDTSIAANPYCSSLPWRPRYSRAITCQLNKSRQANTQQLRVSLSAALALLLPVTSIVSQGERPLKCCLVIPATKCGTYYRLIRKASGAIKLRRRTSAGSRFSSCAI